MRIKDIKHRKLIGIDVTNGWSYHTILGTSLISKTLNGKFNLYTFKRGCDLDFYKDDDYLVKDFKSREDAETTLLRLCNLQLQHSLFFITASHQYEMEQCQ